MKKTIKSLVLILLLISIVTLYNVTGCSGGGGGGSSSPATENPTASPTSSTTTTPTSSPTVSPTTSPTPSTGYQESFFGVFNSHDHDSYNHFKTLTGMDEQDFYDWADNHQKILKFHWSRTNTELVWDLVEPDFDGNYVWDNGMDADDNIRAFTKTGQVNLWLVIEGNRRDGNDWKENKEKFQAYVRACVERYDGDGIDDAPGNPVINYWQSLNERGIAVNNNSITVEDYITYTTWMEEAVHQANPNAKIILVAHSPNGNEMHQDMKDIIDGLVAAGVSFDVVDMHSWGNKNMWRMDSIADCREFLDGRGLQNVQIWSGENGTWVGQPDNAVVYQTEEDQARFLVKRYAYGPSIGLSKILWNNLCEWYNFAGEPGIMFNSMGLVGDGECNGEDPDRLNVPRIAYHSYSMLASAIDRPSNEYVGVMSITDNNNIYGYKYREKSTGKYKYIIWMESGSGNVTFDVSASSVTVTNLITDADGNIVSQETINAVNGKVTLSIGDDPFLVVEN